MIFNNDVLTQLKLFPDESYTGCLCDPPYGINFMNKKWDYGIPPVEMWKELLRVLVPGSYLLAFGGTRTFHRLFCNIEDAGFQIIDTICWLHGQGFPKSLNVSKSIDRKLGKIELGEVKKGAWSNNTPCFGNLNSEYLEQLPSPQAILFNGYKTQLKPAFEPICLAMKPIKNFAENALKYGIAGMNIDACRVGSDGGTKGTIPGHQGNCYGEGLTGNKGMIKIDAGRYPANLILDEEAAKLLGGASRFFYSPKASTSERNAGLDNSVYVSIIKEWKENNIIKEVQLANILVDTDTLQKKDITDFITKEDYEWHMMLFGKKYLEKYQKDLKFITRTETNLTITSQILNYLHTLLTKDYTLDVKLSMENGGNLVVNAENYNTLTITINENQALVLGVKNVVYPMLLKISVKDATNRHCTVKPLKLLKYIATLIKPPTNSKMIVPFSGSGSEMIGGLLAGWNNVDGIEIDKNYCEIAIKRIDYAQKKAKEEVQEKIKSKNCGNYTQKTFEGMEY